MKHLLKPIQTTSLKQEVIAHFENLILSGKLKPGYRLPPERELADRLEVSRPIVHEGLVELASRGLVTITPRKGTYINDYLNHGNLGIVNTLLDYQSTDDLDPKILKDLLNFRLSVEVRTAEMAALERSDEHLREFDRILKKEESLEGLDAAGVAETDFRFHHLCSVASGNLIYPLLVNSLRDIYLTILERFYSDRENIPWVKEIHIRFVAAVRRGDAAKAGEVMKEILLQGGERLLKQVTGEKTDE